MKKSLPIQFKFYISILIIALIPLVIMPIIGYQYTAKVIQNKVFRLSQQQVKRAAKDFNEVMEDVIVGSNVLTLDKEIQGYFENTSQLELAPFKITRRIEDKIHYMQASNLYSYNVETILMDHKGNVYHTSVHESMDYSRIKESEIFEKVLNLKGYFYWTNEFMEFDNEKESLTLLRSVRDEYYNNIGILAIKILPNKNERLVGLEFLNEDISSVFIADSKGQIIFNDRLNPFQNYDSLHEKLKNEGVFVTEVEGKRMVLTAAKVDRGDWYIVQVQEFDKIMLELTGYRDWNIAMNILFIFIILLAAFLASKVITKAIIELNRIIEKVSEGDFKERVYVSGSSEINQLSANFNCMIDRIEQLLTKVEFETRKKEEKRLEALQAQISPHFLLNTLNGIKWLVVMKDNEKAEKMIIALGTLLERTLGNNRAVVTLDEGIQCLKYYCEIQKMRYGDTFDISFQITEELKEIYVPTLFLQPLVENCILHAFHDIEGKGHIWVKAYRMTEFVIIEVWDNGSGISEDTIEKVLKGKRSRNFNSIGVSNVIERIQLYYKPPCRMEILSNESEGTCVKLIIRDSLEGNYDSSNC